MNERTKIAFETARDTTKQAITLSVSMLLVMVAFSKNFIAVTEETPSVYFEEAVIVFLGSIFFGLLTLMEITSEISPKSNSRIMSHSNLRQYKFIRWLLRLFKKTLIKCKISHPSIWAKCIRVLAFLQLSLFFVGLLFVAISLLTAINSASSASNWIKKIDTFPRLQFFMSCG